MANIGNIDVEIKAKLTISEETAKTCLMLVQMYCSDQRGGEDALACHENCKGCVFYDLRNYYCKFKCMSVYEVKK